MAKSGQLSMSLLGAAGGQHLRSSVVPRPGWIGVVAPP